jgi:BlaI family penicillinase repressor
MSPQPIPPTKLELAILRALWRKGPGTVREIHAAVNESRPAGYTTVLKMLQIMSEKGLVLRDDTARPQIYRVRHTQEQTQSHLVKDLIQRAFDGSVKALVMQALSTRKSSRKDLDTIKKLLDKLEGDSQ